MSGRGPIFNDDAGLDTSQVQDHRGRSAGKVGAVGGGIGIIVLLVGMLLGVDTSPVSLGGDGTSIFGQLEDQTVGSDQSQGALAQTCRTGADANAREDCLHRRLRQ